MAINAIRLRTTDARDAQGRYRYLQAANGGGGVLVAARVANPAQWETFFFDPASNSPLANGYSLAMAGIDLAWQRNGMLVRVDHGVHVYRPQNSKDPIMVTYEIGGSGQAVWVTTGFPAGYPAYPGDDEQERTFDLVKPTGGPINNGDAVSLRINSNLGQTFFFRVTGGQDKAEIDGDGNAAGRADTTFIVELAEVMTGVGVCGKVQGKVTRAVGGQAIAGAFVEALGLAGNVSYTATTNGTGDYTLSEPTRGTCLPAGNIRVRASANRYKTKTIDPVNVPAAGTVTVAIQLECTPVKIIVVDSANLPVVGTTVMLLDSSGNLLFDLTGQPYIGTTGLDGSVTFYCVPHGAAAAQTQANPNQLPQFTVPPDGTTQTIHVQNTCGNLVGKVTTDTLIGIGIPNATVTVPGTNLQMLTDANGGFRFNCVRPAGQKTVVASAPSCGIGTGTVNVPTSGDSQLLVIPLHCSVVTVDKICAILQWAAQPADLDLHLSGPDGQGGRFHLYFGNRGNPPVPYVNLDVDDTSAFGPETVCISKSGNGFVAGDYHVWVHDFSSTTFAGSSAVVTIVRLDPQGVPTQLTRQEVQFAAGNQADGLWHVANISVAANGTASPTAVQTLLLGNALTVL